MKTHNIPFSIKNKENHPKLSQIFNYRFLLALKNEFETAVVNEPSVFEPLKFYCMSLLYSDRCHGEAWEWCTRR